MNTTSRTRRFARTYLRFTALVFAISACATKAPSPQPAPRPADSKVGKAIEQPGPAQPAVPVGVAACTLPAVTGRCRAAFRRFHFDAASGACKPFLYGGCDGNANNFSTASACIAACAPTPELNALGAELTSGRVAIGCKVGESYYPSGAGAIASPDGANTCRCHAGDLECTRRRGEWLCPADTVFGKACAESGTAGGCLIRETGCLPMCINEQDCLRTDYPRCIDHRCVN